jgi:hypothetical protein
VLEDLDFKIASLPINGFELREGQYFNVQMPADLDQFRRDNSHGTVVRREGFVQLSHSPTYGRAFFQEVDIISGIGQIKS